jgi:hypothetical protein
MADFGAREQKFSFKKPWLFDEFQTMMNTIDEAEIYLGSGVVTVESQFKKPYNKLDHPTSENFFEGPPGTPVNTVPNFGLPGNDCRPVGDGIGGGALSPCDPTQSCGQWRWTCAHRIISFDVVQENGHIQSIQYGKDDTVTVTICWDEGGIAGHTKKGSLVRTADGAAYESSDPVSSGNCGGKDHDPGCPNCQECPQNFIPIVVYTSLQMTSGGSQALYAYGGDGGPYTWTITGGGGSFDGGKKIAKTDPYQYVIYHAPALTNVDCSLNPTIQIKGQCGHYVLLRIAINSDTSGSGFASKDAVWTWTGVDWSICYQGYLCDGTASGGCVPQGGCTDPGGTHMCGNPSCPVNYCDPAHGFVGNTLTCPNCNAGVFIEPQGYFDVRTPAQKAAGCCPQQLL